MSPSEDTVAEPVTAEQQELLDRYVAAFENYDIPAMVKLFTSDAVWEMPPFPGWYIGAEAIGRLIGTQCPAKGPGDMRLVPTMANGQPAFGLYMRSLDGDVPAVQPAGARPSGRRHHARGLLLRPAPVRDVRAAGEPAATRRAAVGQPAGGAAGGGLSRVAMTDARARAALLGGIGLLERAINYTLGSLHLVSPEALPLVTPCPAWDVRALLAHLDDSLAAMAEALDDGRVDPEPVAGTAESAADPSVAIRHRAVTARPPGPQPRPRPFVSIADASLTASIVVSTGAIEIAVHGWDLAQACGSHRPIPPSLAEELLELAVLFVADADRPVRFAPPVGLSPASSPGDRLLAFLGRQPQRALSRGA